jgi:8-oxo-dGTP pyrophosphatase MutT (NUDIX family)
MQWTVHGEKPLYQDEWLDIRIADVELPNGQRFGHRLIRTPPGAGCVVVRDGQVLLLWRHRFITGSWTWEIPFGKVDPGEELAHAAARETEEETGWRPGPLMPLLTVEPTAGLADSVHHVYLADGAEHVGPPRDGYESSRIAWMDLADVPAVIGRGEISMGTAVAALLYTITTLRARDGGSAF